MLHRQGIHSCMRFDTTCQYSEPTMPFGAWAGNFEWNFEDVAKSIMCMMMSGPFLTGYTQVVLFVDVEFYQLLLDGSINLHNIELWAVNCRL